MYVDKSLPAQILELLSADGCPVGAHLPAQLLADRLGVSRSPVNDALEQLHRKGLLRRERNRGYFLDQPVEKGGLDWTQRLGSDTPDGVTAAYFRLAEDRLAGLLEDGFTETLIRQRYGLTGGQAQSVLNRILHEGWVQKKAGYGWAFTAMVTTPDSLLQSYRMRLALEPAALLEPGYSMDTKVLEKCRAAELHLLSGGIETDTPFQLHERGVLFHEALVEASGNAFFIDAIQRLNRVRRLISYRSMKDRQRYKAHCKQHLGILALIERGDNVGASEGLRAHLLSTLQNIQKIKSLLDANSPSTQASQP